jgi:hypothetical protein
MVSTESAFDAIVLTGAEEQQVQVVAERVEVISKTLSTSFGA